MRMHLRKTMLATALVVGLVALPSSAGARGGHGHHAGDRDWGGGDVPNRIQSRLDRAERSLDRAIDYIDDEEATRAQASLRSVNKNLAAALKSAKRRATTESGVASLEAVADAQHDIIEELTTLFDGADADLVTAVSTGLDGAITGRDDLVAAIAALTPEQREDYEYLLEEIGEDVDAEIAAIDEALADDTLSAEATTALNDAKTKLTATKAAVTALLPAATTPTSDGNTAAGDDEDCPDRGGSRGDRGPRGAGGGRFGDDEDWDL
jgi:glycine cleavage system regulatory protein